MLITVSNHGVAKPALEVFTDFNHLEHIEPKRNIPFFAKYQSDNV